MKLSDVVEKELTWFVTKWADHGYDEPKMMKDLRDLIEKAVEENYEEWKKVLRTVRELK